MPAVYKGTRDIPIADLTPFPGNARRGDVPRIAESLALNGQYRSVVVRDTGRQLVILAGNHTTKGISSLAALTPGELEASYGRKIRSAIDAATSTAAREAARLALAQLTAWSGVKTVRCEVIECDDAEARRINLADNHLSDLATDDPEDLAALLEALDGDFDGSGWTEEDALPIIEAAGHDDPGGDGDGFGDSDDGGGRGDLLALAGVTVGEPRHLAETGQIWALGPHRLVVADLFTGWDLWAPLLTGDVTFLPYPTPLAPHAPSTCPLVMVQPETYLAAMLLDKWEDITGAGPVVVNGASE